MTPRKRRERLGSIHEIADKLRQSADVAAPDLTNSILSRVHANREFLDRKTRNMIWVGRGAIGASVAMVVLSVAVLQRFAPDSMDLSSRPAPLSTVVESVKSEAGERLVSLRLAVDAASPAQSSETDDLESSTGGGLFSLVSMAAPPPMATAGFRPCTFCGPCIPPAQAARTLPPPSGEDTAPRTLASVKLSGQSAAGGPAMLAIGPASARFAVRGRFGGQGEPPVVAGLGDRQPGLPPAGVASADLRAISLNELAPLGSAGSADSALAPK